MGEDHLMSTPDKYLKKFEDFGIYFIDIEPYLRHLSPERQSIIRLRWENKLSAEKTAEICKVLPKQLCRLETHAIKRLELAAYKIIIKKKFRKIQAEAERTGNMKKYWECEHEIAKLMVDGEKFINKYNFY